MLTPLLNILSRTGLDAVVLVPGANFRRVFGKDFHQMERPLAVVVPRQGEAVAIVPHLEMGSFTPIGFPGKVFPWRDEAGYMGAFMAAGEALPQLRNATRIGVEGQRMRVFDLFALQQALAGAKHVLVIDRSLDPGMGGPLASNVDLALRNLAAPPAIHSAIAGLGGRPITKASLHRLFRQALEAPWEGPHFLDLNERVIGRELHRRGKTRRAGPAAENILKIIEAERAQRLDARDAGGA